MNIRVPHVDHDLVHAHTTRDYLMFTSDNHRTYIARAGWNAVRIAQRNQCNRGVALRHIVVAVRNALSSCNRLNLGDSTRQLHNWLQS
ncbi:unannotated protein [freshwater metagenome]|uniref:Unannotated protein n=1 Tax=freshwater metagenome TaxID=449393 RepID=A0A6J6VTQ0_9ZZZZ